MNSFFPHIHGIYTNTKKDSDRFPVFSCNDYMISIISCLVKCDRSCIDWNTVGTASRDVLTYDKIFYIVFSQTMLIRFGDIVAQRYTKEQHSDTLVIYAK